MFFSVHLVLYEFFSHLRLRQSGRAAGWKLGGGFELVGCREKIGPVMLRIGKTIDICSVLGIFRGSFSDFPTIISSVLTPAHPLVSRVPSRGEGTPIKSISRGARKEILKFILRGANKLTQIIISDPKRCVNLTKSSHF